MNEFLLAAIFFTSLLVIFAYLSWREELVERRSSDSLESEFPDQSYPSYPVGMRASQEGRTGEFIVSEGLSANYNFTVNKKDHESSSE